MYDNILFKPLKLRSNITAEARAILEGVNMKSVRDSVVVMHCFIASAKRQDQTIRFWPWRCGKPTYVYFLSDLESHTKLF